MPLETQKTARHAMASSRRWQHPKGDDMSGTRQILAADWLGNVTIVTEVGPGGPDGPPAYSITIRETTDGFPSDDVTVEAILTLTRQQAEDVWRALDYLLALSSASGGPLWSDVSTKRVAR